MIDTPSQTARCFVARDYDLFAGLDVDKRSISITFSDHGGIIKSMKIPYNSEQLVQYTRNHFADRKVVFGYEAGPTGYGLHDDLTAEDYRCLVIAPSMIPKAAGERVKTNRLDSQKLSLALRGGQVKGIHVPSASYRQLRHLTHLRDTHVREVAATKNRIKAMLLLEGIPFPEAPAGKGQWSLRVIEQLKILDLPQTLRFKMGQFLSTLAFHKQQMLATQREIHRFCRNDPEMKRSIELLTTIPGIGIIVATHLLARIGDWREIQNVRQLSAFLGLVPCENSTGDDVRRGSITRMGDPRLRGKLIQGAWAAIRKDPELGSFYQRVCQKHHRDQGPRKAIVAVARKLTTRIYAVLKEQRPYEIRH